MFYFYLLVLSILSYSAICATTTDSEICNSISVSYAVAETEDGISSRYCYRFTTTNHPVTNFSFSVVNSFTLVPISGYGLFNTTTSNLYVGLTSVNAMTPDATQCFFVKEPSGPIKGSLNVTSGNTKCSYNVRVPGIGSLCPCINRNCVYETRSVLYKYGPCIGNCIDRKPHVNGTQIYIKPLLTYSSNKTACPTTFVQTCIKACGVDCLLATTYARNSCGKCSAICSNKNTEIGSMLCMPATLAAPSNGGKPCMSNKTTVGCFTKCPKSCVYETPWLSSISCPVNCAKTTASFEIFATLVKNLNQDISCATNSFLSYATCTMPQAQYTSICKSSCAAHGILTDPCSSRCKETPLARPFITSADYPILSNYKRIENCPTSTKTCSCNDCSLELTPTKTISCDATCSRYDDSFAFGKEIQYYKVLSKPKNDGNCVNTKTSLCSKKCSCKTVSSTIGDCALKDKQTSTVPWIACGTAFVTPFFGEKKCGSCGNIEERECCSILQPKNCHYSRNCFTPTCTSQQGSNYLQTLSQTCSNVILQTGTFGGTPCPDYSVTNTISTTCPGCDYSMDAYCNCLFSKTSVGACKKVTLFGNRYCTFPLINRFPQSLPISSFNPNSAKTLCTPSVSSNLDSVCSTVLPITGCAYSTSTCGPCTATSTYNVDSIYYRTGVKECLLKDIGKLQSKNCPLQTSTVTCKEILGPQNCQITAICETRAPKCTPGVEEMLTDVVKCSVRTLTPSLYGGYRCPMYNMEPMACSRKCPGKKIPKGIDDMLLAITTEFDISLFNTNVGGRIISHGHATLLNVNVGTQVGKIEAGGCSKLFPMLFVNSSLMMLGSVKSGAVKVNGKCTTNAIESTCKINCHNNKGSNETVSSHHTDDGDGDHCDRWSDIDLKSISDYIKFMSNTFKNLVGNARTTEYVQGMLQVQWDDTSILQVIKIRENDGGIQLFKPLNWFKGNYPKEVIINIYGTSVTISGGDYYYFYKIASTVYWNFIEATEVKLLNTVICGRILAPYAKVSGNAKIIGRLSAKSVYGTEQESISVNLF